MIRESGNSEFRWFRNPVIRKSDDSGIWSFGNLMIRESGNPEIWWFGNFVIRKSDDLESSNLEIWLFGNPIIWESSSLEIWWFRNLVILIYSGILVHSGISWSSISEIQQPGNLIFEKSLVRQKIQGKWMMKRFGQTLIWWQLLYALFAGKKKDCRSWISVHSCMNLVGFSFSLYQLP